MKITVLTLFVQFFESIKSYSIIKRAIDEKKLELEIVDIRDYADNKHKKVDDYPYGGGQGMVMMAQPTADCIMANKKNAKVYYLSAKGEVLNQQKLNNLSKEEHIILLNGHYEGLDQRVIDDYVDEEISIGDYVLTGGEVASMVLIDGITRLLPGVLSDKNSYLEESHYSGLLEYPHYTRPFDFRGRKVPEVLLSGHHENIKKYRLRKSLELTLNLRPDLLEKKLLSNEEQMILKDILKGGKSDGHN